MRSEALIACLLAVSALGCAQGGSDGDAGPDRPPLMVDAGSEPDAGPPPRDPSECTAYVCPPGMELTALGGQARCSRVISPRPSGARRYCHFLTSHGVLGFSWMPASLVFTCPPEMEAAPNAEAGYCLYREVAPPAGFETACEDFETTGELGFVFPCEL